MDGKIQQAIKVFNQGGIVIFPTDTAFGIGCRIDDEKAVERLFKIRKRPETKAVPVLISSLKMAEVYLLPVSDDVIEKLIKPFWPGALTIVLRSRTENVPSLVRGGTKTLGVRVPNHLTTLKMINSVGVPILGPSANFHGEKTPYAFDELDKDLVKLADFVLPGDCIVKQSSTVIDVSVNPWKVLRDGAVHINIV